MVFHPSSLMNIVISNSLYLVISLSGVCPHVLKFFILLIVLMLCNYLYLLYLQNLEFFLI